MLNKWLDLWKRIKAEGEPTQFYKLLIELYSEPHRRYHNLNHIKFCLKEFESVKHLAEDPEAVETAIWFHDIIYKIGAQDNELKSAEFTVKFLKKVEVNQTFIKKVYDLIVLTDHRKTALTSDSKILVDIDLATLGQSEKDFNEYRINIRKEYIDTPFIVYGAKRAKLLQKFLDRPRIYQTKFFRGKYEEKARENLEKAISLIKQKLI